MAWIIPSLARELQLVEKANKSDADAEHRAECHTDVMFGGRAARSRRAQRQDAIPNAKG